jgi:hypothetical protein
VDHNEQDEKERKMHLALILMGSLPNFAEKEGIFERTAFL